MRDGVDEIISFYTDEFTLESQLQSATVQLLSDLISLFAQVTLGDLHVNFNAF